MLNSHFYSTIIPSTYALSYDLQLDYRYSGKFFLSQPQTRKKVKDYVRGNSVVVWGYSVVQKYRV